MRISLVGVDSVLQKGIHESGSSQRCCFNKRCDSVSVSEVWICALPEEEHEDIESVHHDCFVKHCSHVVHADAVIDFPSASVDLILNFFKVITLHGLKFLTDEIGNRGEPPFMVFIAQVVVSQPAVREDRVCESTPISLEGVHPYWVLLCCGATAPLFTQNAYMLLDVTED